MMTTLGNKKNVKIFSFALAGVFIASVAAMAVVSMGDTANAAPTSDIGVVDQREVISANSTLAANYQQKMKETADEMQKDFDAKSAGMSDAEKEKLFADMQQQFNQKRQAIEKDMDDQVTGAVKSVAPRRALLLLSINLLSFTAAQTSPRKSPTPFRSPFLPPPPLPQHPQLPLKAKNKDVS